VYLQKILNLSIFTIIIFLFTACAVDNQQLENGKKIYPKEPISQKLIDEVNQIALLINQNNFSLLNAKYIHPINGFYDITKIENRNIFEIKKSISDIDSNIDSFVIRFDKVTFDCSPYDDSLYGWDKYGIFISSQTKPYVSKIMEEANIIQPNSYKLEDIEKMDFMEQTSYEVTIPYVIIFYIAKIDNQWYITLIDNVTTDCSR
jgi:hypothetical protein